MEIVEELAQHLDERYERRLAGGASHDDAITAAWRELDDSDVLGRAIARVESPAPLSLPPAGAAHQRRAFTTVWQDIRYSARTLRRSPVFSLTVLLAIALSIGPVSAIVSVGNWLLWRPHPGVADARSLAVVWFGHWKGNGVSPSGVSHANLDDMRARARSFTGIAGFQESDASLAVPGRTPVQRRTAVVSGDFFDVIGVRPVAGRTFTADDDRGMFGPPVVVISHSLSVSAFGSPEAALDKSLALNSQPFTIIGVAPAAFEGVSNPGSVEVWLPGAAWRYMNHATDARYESRADGLFYAFVVRAAPGSTFTEVESELKVLARRLADDHPADNKKFLDVVPRVFPGLGLQPLTRASTKTMVNTLLAVGGLLLLLGCANVANLLVFRAARREHEIAVRKALGASRARLLQLHLTESWMLAFAGAALGLILAVYLKQIIDQLLFPKPPGMSFSVPMDVRVLAATAGLALVTGTLAALAPGWLLTRTRGLAALGRTTMTWSRAPKLRGALAAVQLALTLTLLIGALLLVSTLRNLRAVDLGLDPRDVSVVNVNLDEHGYDRARTLAYHREVLPALQSRGDFEAVTLAQLPPFGSSTLIRIAPPGGPPNETLSVRANGVSADYFRVLSQPIVRGRAFTADEAAGLGDGTPLIINESLARRLFGTIDAVGRTITLSRTAARAEQDLVVVGVARDSRWRSIDGKPDPFLYQPFGHFYRVASSVYMIKSKLPSQRVGEIANAIAARTAGSIPLFMARPLSTGIDRELSQQRLFAWMLSILAGLGFVLAALGLYGLVAQATVERRREFGIRLALGAAAGDIVRLVGGFALTVSAAGIIVGLTLTFFGTRLIRSMLFGVSPLDPLVYIAAVSTLAAVVALACAGPAWRAMRVSPVEVLRAE